MPSDLGLRRSRPEEYTPDRRELDRKRDRGSRRSRSKSIEKVRSPDRKRRRDRTRSRSPPKETLSSVRLDARRAREERPRSRSASRDRRERRLRKERDSSSGHHSMKPVRRRESEESTIFATPIMAMEEDDEGALASMMGFSSFDSTKGKKVEGNDVGIATVAVKRKYRQYMNRRGGFNRPLDAVH